MRWEEGRGGIGEVFFSSFLKGGRRGVVRTEDFCRWVKNCSLLRERKCQYDNHVPPPSEGCGDWAGWYVGKRGLGKR